MTIRAKSYQNRKEEKKVQVSLDRDEAVKLVKGDKTVSESVNEAIKQALKPTE